MSRRTWLRGLAIVALAGVILLAGSAALLRVELQRPHAGWSGPSVDVDLPSGLSAEAMIDKLVEAGVLRRASTARLGLRWSGGAEQLHAGEYRFERPASTLEVLARLRRGDVLLHPVTLPEGLVLDEIALRLSEAGFGTTEALMAAFGDPTPILELDPLATDLEGYLFPETYRFSRDATPATMAATLVERFRETVGPDFAERAESVGLTMREAVTLASMIERETSVGAERGRISAVFHNRLKRNMRMQCDPTVIYALHRAGQEVKALRLRHLEFDSPWNTYRVAGLPPGPIANPGRESLEAAVNPDPSDELYFVAAPEGGHRFSRSLAEHNRAVTRWRAYLRSSR